MRAEPQCTWEWSSTEFEKVMGLFVAGRALYI